jgi:hypothetical protein
MPPIPKTKIGQNIERLLKLQNATKTAEEINVPDRESALPKTPEVVEFGFTKKRTGYDVDGNGTTDVVMVQHFFDPLHFNDPLHPSDFSDETTREYFRLKDGKVVETLVDTRNIGGPGHLGWDGLVDEQTIFNKNGSETTYTDRNFDRLSDRKTVLKGEFERAWMDDDFNGSAEKYTYSSVLMPDPLETRVDANNDGTYDGDRAKVLQFVKKPSGNS